jgi:hypothetical protein
MRYGKPDVTRDSRRAFRVSWGRPRVFGAKFGFCDDAYRQSNRRAACRLCKAFRCDQGTRHPAVHPAGNPESRACDPAEPGTRWVGRPHRASGRRVHTAGVDSRGQDRSLGSHRAEGAAGTGICDHVAAEAGTQVRKTTTSAGLSRRNAKAPPRQREGLRLGPAAIANEEGVTSMANIRQARARAHDQASITGIPACSPTVLS